MGISGSLSHSNGWSIVSLLVATATLISSWIRVESFSTIQNTGRTSSLCEPLRASFAGGEENSKTDIEILNEFREGQLREALLADQFLSTNAASDGDSGHSTRSDPESSASIPEVCRLSFRYYFRVVEKEKI